MKFTNSILFTLLVLITQSCSTNNNKIAAADSLKGVWTPVKQEMAGQQLPAVIFEKQKLILSDSNYTVIAESIDKGIVRYTDYKIDIYGKEGVNAGKHFTAIYKFENDLLVICYNLSGDSYPATFDTKGKPLYFLSEFKKLMK